MNTSTVKAIFLDIDDTLLDFNLCADYSMHYAADIMGINLPDDFLNLFHRINNSLWEKMERGEITNQEIYDTRFNLIFREAHISADGHIFEKEFKNGLHESHIPVDGAMDLLRYLHPNYKLYAASNGPYEQQKYRLAKADMLSLFEDIFISERVGCSKPMPGFFDVCFSLMPGIEPGETVMIGDSLTSDIKGAHDYGIPTIWFNKNGKSGHPKEVDYKVDSLSEIRNIL